MELSLKYIQNSGRSVAGAFIRGSSAQAWLMEFDRWQIPAEGCTCYLVPQGLHAIAPGGLFVAFGKKHVPPLQHIASPYSLLAEKLYIPHNAELYPQVSSDELRALLLFDTMVWHPATGLTGYEKNEHIDLVSLVEAGQPAGRQWHYAVAGSPRFPALQRITVEQPAPKDLLDTFKEDIGSKALEDIKTKEEKESTALTRLAESIGLLGLKGLAAITGGILSAFTKQVNAPAEKKGALDKLNSWAQEKIEDLEKKRQSELQRLLSLFEENSDDALLYAIPLGGSYQERGEAPKSARLTRRDGSFNLGRLGGGGKVDSWDLGTYYNDLRQKYLKAAKKEIEHGNYKKAAYIYAHLLNDLHSAADTLKKGQMFREAAAIYRDHLKNMAAAAECLESGGLYHEAIDLYTELGKDEKAGDLYVLLAQTDKANKYYEKCVETALEHNDFMEAARIQDTKKHEAEKATATLLQGWLEPGQQERCLLKYFERLDTGESGSLLNNVQAVYSTKMPASKRSSFLSVITQLVGKTKDEAVKQAATEMAYTIVSGQLASGDGTGLAALKQFIPGDKLVGADINRFMSTAAPAKRYLSPVENIKLHDNVTWHSAIKFKNDFIAFGFTGKLLCLERISAEGASEFQVITRELLHRQELNLVADPFFTDTIFNFSYSPGSGAKKVLEENQHFASSLTLAFPAWMPRIAIAAAISGRDRITFLCQEEKAISMHHYTLDGQLKDIVTCDLNVFPTGHGRLFDLVYRRECFYITLEQSIFCIYEDGSSRDFHNDAMITQLIATDHHLAQRFMLNTVEGCQLLRMADRELKARSPYFAADIAAASIVYAHDNKLLLAEKNRVTVFDITDDKPAAIAVVETDEEIVSVMPGSRNTFAVLDKKGQLAIHTV